MNLQYFEHFLKVNYPMVRGEVSDDDIAEIGRGFKSYLEEKFKGHEEKLTDIWDINLTTVIPNFKHPYRVNGYHPALLIHFSEFIKKQLQN